MIGTLCFIADFDTENFLNEFKMEASEKYRVGVTGGNVPRHISLGMPYDVPDWNRYVEFAYDFARTLRPVTARITGMVTASFPTPDVGAFVLKFEEDFGLDSIRAGLTETIREKLGIEIKDNLIGKRLVALGCGTAPVENYRRYVESLDPAEYVGKTIRFDQLGIFYYPSANWDPATYMCYRKIML